MSLLMFMLLGEAKPRKRSALDAGETRPRASCSKVGTRTRCGPRAKRQTATVIAMVTLTLTVRRVGGAPLMQGRRAGTADKEGFTFNFKYLHRYSTWDSNIRMGMATPPTRV